MKERMNERMKERMKKRMKERKNERIAKKNEFSITIAYKKVRRICKMCLASARKLIRPVKNYQTMQYQYQVIHLTET